MALQFPENPTLGQIFVGTNAVTYQYAGDRWSTPLAIYNNVYNFAYEGGDAFSIFNPLIDNVLDGGNAE